jgi:hypothetical protein
MRTSAGALPKYRWVSSSFLLQSLNLGWLKDKNRVQFRDNPTYKFNCQIPTRSCHKLTIQLSHDTQQMQHWLEISCTAPISLRLMNSPGRKNEEKTTFIILIHLCKLVAVQRVFQVPKKCICSFFGLCWAVVSWCWECCRCGYTCTHTHDVFLRGSRALATDFLPAVCEASIQRWSWHNTMECYDHPVCTGSRK